MNKFRFLSSLVLLAVFLSALAIPVIVVGTTLPQSGVRLGKKYITTWVEDR